MFDEEELERRLRRADPATTPPDAQLSVRAEADLRRIITGSGAKKSPRRQGRWLALPALGALLVLAFFLVQQVLPSNVSGNQTAMAATPPVLTGTGTPRDFAVFVKEAAAKLRDQEPETPTRRASYEAWYVNTDFDADGSTFSYVSPQEVTTTWRADLSGEITVVTGTPYLPEGSIAPDTEPTAAGALVREESFGAGEMGIVFAAEPPTDAASMSAYLTEYGGVMDPKDPAQVLEAVGQLLSEWTLSGAEHSALLESLAEVPGFESIGSVTDRLGRAGLGFSAQSPADPRFQSILVLDATTGEILSMEKVYLGGVPEFSFDPPTVTSYIAWK